MKRFFTPSPEGLAALERVQFCLFIALVVSILMFDAWLVAVCTGLGLFIIVAEIACAFATVSAVIDANDLKAAEEKKQRDEKENA